LVERVRDIVGLCLSPPARALVLCVDEKSQIQALDRTQPLLPLRPGRVERRTRWHTHDTPTSASWISLVERFFANLTEKPIRRGAHRSTEELEAAIASYIDAVNAKPKPFVWTKSADDILASVKRFCAATLSAAQTQIQIATTSESGH
jgi:hypothetical protein